MPMVVKMNRLILILIASGISFTLVFILFFASSANLSRKINVFDLVSDSISSVYRMFAALAIAFLPH